MARFLSSRLAKLEKKMRPKIGANRVLVYRPENRESGATGNFQGPMLCGYHPARKNAAAGRFDPLPGRYMLAPDFGKAGEWEKALRAQQRALMAKASVNVGKQSTNKGS